MFVRAAEPTRRRHAVHGTTRQRPRGTHDPTASTGPRIQVGASRCRADRLVRDHQWPAVEVDHTRHRDISAQTHQQLTHAGGSVAHGLLELKRLHLLNLIECLRDVREPRVRATSLVGIQSATRPGSRSNPKPEARSPLPRQDGSSEPEQAQLREPRSQPRRCAHLITSEIAVRVVSLSLSLARICQRCGTPCPYAKDQV